MQKMKLPSYEQAQQILNKHHLSITAAELHGLLTGFFCLEPQQDSTSWQQFLRNYLNDSDELPAPALDLAQLCIENIRISLNQEDHLFPFLLPDDQSNNDQLDHEQLQLSLENYAFALTDWLNSFLSALGLTLDQSVQLDEEIHSVLMDLSQMARLEIDTHDNILEQFAIFEEVLEYISGSIFFFYDQLGRQHDDPMIMNSEPTIH